MNVKQVGDVLGDLSVATAEDSAVADEIDEYFRVNFRKISFEDAMYVSNQLGLNNDAKKIAALDEKFWIWETLEEATRPHLHTMDFDTLCNMYKGWILNLKGSEDFHHIAQDRMRYFTVDLGDLSNPGRDK